MKRVINAHVLEDFVTVGIERNVEGVVMTGGANTVENQ